MKEFKKYTLITLKWIALSVITGITCGAIGTLFSKTLEFVTNLRTGNGWLLYLLPIGGIVIVLLYKLLKVEGVGTVTVFESIKKEKELSASVVPAIFISSAVSHLFGASVGREGAALQIGGGMASLYSKIFKLTQNERKIILMCGMAGLFSAVFGTPIGAAAFALEVILIKLCLNGALPVLLTSLVSFFTAEFLGARAERFNLMGVPKLSFNVFWRVAVILSACVIACFIFCKSLSLSKKLFKIHNPYLKIIVGGLIVIALTLLAGNNDYNGGGVNIIENVFNGNVKYEAFALKVIFTAICIGTGFKGGEIIPTFFIGATCGGAAAMLLGLPVPFGGAIGMAVLFCGATNCPVATVLLCAEMFSGQGIWYIIPVTAAAFFLCRFEGLYGKKYKILKRKGN